VTSRLSHHNHPPTAHNHPQPPPKNPRPPAAARPADLHGRLRPHRAPLARLQQPPGGNGPGARDRGLCQSVPHLVHPVPVPLDLLRVPAEVSRLQGRLRWLVGFFVLAGWLAACAPLPPPDTHQTISNPTKPPKTQSTNRRHQGTSNRSGTSSRPRSWQLPPPSRRPSSST
jgi:hypothetical protein